MHIDWQTYTRRLQFSHNSEGAPRIFDPVRRKYVAITPEELVRQAVVQFLIVGKCYPKALLQTEYAILVNGLPKRCDIIAFSRDAAPFLLVETKRPTVAIDETTFAQAARYNLALPVKYWLLTNGVQSYLFELDYEHQTWHRLDDLPEYDTV